MPRTPKCVHPEWLVALRHMCPWPRPHQRSPMRPFCVRCCLAPCLLARMPRRGHDFRERGAPRSRGLLPGLRLQHRWSPRPAPQVGHWEGDLVVGRKGGSHVGTLVVERSSRYLVLLHLANGAGTDSVIAALIAAIETLPSSLRRSVTGTAGSNDASPTFHRPDRRSVFFSAARSPWQRGTNENTNGLLRQYIPKGTDITVHTAAQTFWPSLMRSTTVRAGPSTGRLQPRSSPRLRRPFESTADRGDVFTCRRQPEAHHQADCCLWAEAQRLTAYLGGSLEVTWR